MSKAPASDWPDVSPAGLRKMAEIAAPNNGVVFRAAADEIERLSAERAPAPTVAEPVMTYLGRHTMDCGEHGSHNMEMHKLIPAGTKLYDHAAPTAQEASKRVQAEAASEDADPLTPEQEEWVMDLAEKHNLGRRIGQIAAMRYRLDAWASSPPSDLACNWMPIESAPKDGTTLLLRSRKGRVADGCWVPVNGNKGYWAWALVNQEPAEWAPMLSTTPPAQAVQEAAAKGDKALLDFLSEQVKGDTTICPPGQHGGADSAWLVSIETSERDRYGAFCNEHEGATLRDAIRAASDRKGGV